MVKEIVSQVKSKTLGSTVVSHPLIDAVQTRDNKRTNDIRSTVITFAALAALTVWMVYALVLMPELKSQVIPAYIIMFIVLMVKTGNYNNGSSKTIIQNQKSSPMTITEVVQKFNIVEGLFTPAEAIDVVNGLLDSKINFHKLQVLSSTIGDENCQTEFHDGRIKELMEEKIKLKNYIKQAKAEGRQVQMNGGLEIAYI